MKTDNQIQQDIIDQLQWEPFTKTSVIGVAVKDGIVTLSGRVDCYAKKRSAENAAKKIEGVKAIAEDIQIDVFCDEKISDTAIAQAVVHTLQWHAAIAEENISVVVEHGVVKLEGIVDGRFKRKIAKNAIENIAGVRSVLNLLVVAPSILTVDIEQRIKAAFVRSANIDAAKIRVSAVGDTVVLQGIVRSIAEKEDAENAAWNAPGVCNVENRLKVDLHTQTHMYVD